MNDSSQLESDVELELAVTSSWPDRGPKRYIENSALLPLCLATSNMNRLRIVESSDREPKLVKTIDEKILSYKAGHSHPHTTHCGPELRPPHVARCSRRGR
jgi:hypothetical protein